MKVRSILHSHSSITIDSSWTLAEINKFFGSMGTEYLTVACEGKGLGILSRQRFNNVLERKDMTPELLSKVSVMAIIRTDEQFCEPHHSLKEVYRRMSRDSLRYLAVRSSEKIVGVLSFSTVAAAVMSDMTT